MAARSFEDSAGTVWEVIEVHRASEAPRGVSPGLEKGWLSFVSAKEKRRLAPFPTSWTVATTRELERLCGMARVANPARYPGLDRRVAPRDVSAPVVTDVALPHPPLQADGGADVVRDAIRSFASDARAQNLPAIEALVRLKALLASRFTGEDVAPPTVAAATDMRRVRKWFVESYYFERQ